jgi:saccharopine dehydrogenase-like NADP-dependent oxidoreductase
MSNFILGRCAATMQVQRFEAVVGGLPQERRKPWEYKAPFSPIDVLEEYTRPARYREHGHDITKPALTDVETMDFDGIGTLEAFNTDGLRSLLTSFPNIPTLKEKTLRYPGHAALISTLLQAGMLSAEPVQVQGISVSPLAFNGALLMDQWRLGPHEPELTVMRVVVEGLQQGRPAKVQWDLLDRYDAATATSSMARTTGYTATAMVEAGLRGLLPGPGHHLPEQLGSNDLLFQHLLTYLAKRGVQWRQQWH